MIKDEIYRLLETNMLGYLDYVEMPLQDTQEAMVPIPQNEHLKARQIDNQMIPFTGDQIFVRQTVLDKLIEASHLLALYDPKLTLEVVYGYRTLEIQRQLFEKHSSKFKETLCGNALLEAVHKYIAVPEVAGHPTGGAVDVQLIKNGLPLNFGTAIWEFVDDALTFSPFIGKEAWHNRQLLRRLMIQVGFAPFDGEWWHFSFGDKEWAKYYSKPFAIYKQLNSNEIFNLPK